MWRRGWGLRTRGRGGRTAWTLSPPAGMRSETSVRVERPASPRPDAPTPGVAPIVQSVLILFSHFVDYRARRCFEIGGAQQARSDQEHRVVTVRIDPVCDAGGVD